MQEKHRKEEVSFVTFDWSLGPEKEELRNELNPRPFIKIQPRWPPCNNPSVGSYSDHMVARIEPLYSLSRGNRNSHHAATLPNTVEHNCQWKYDSKKFSPVISASGWMDLKAKRLQSFFFIKSRMKYSFFSFVVESWVEKYIDADINSSIPDFDSTKISVCFCSAS